MFRRSFLLALLALAAWAEGGGSRELEGAWNIQVTGTPGFNSLVTYSASGATVEDNGQPKAGPFTYGPAVGQWRFDRGNTFLATWIKPIYDAASGALVATVKIRARITMQSRDEYTSEDRVDVYAPNGTLLSSAPATQTGRRIQVETF